MAEDKNILNQSIVQEYELELVIGGLSQRGVELISGIVGAAVGIGLGFAMVFAGVQLAIMTVDSKTRHAYRTGKLLDIDEPQKVKLRNRIGTAAAISGVMGLIVTGLNVAGAVLISRRIYKRMYNKRAVRNLP